MLGIIGGTSLLYAKLPDVEKKLVYTPFGPAEVYLGSFALLMRHQFRTPPHKINHAASLSALAICGVDRIVSFGSTGTLKMDTPPGSIVIPDDYYSPAQIPTLNNNFIKHVSPSVDSGLAEKIHEIIPDAFMHRTYVQTMGPRFETHAEIRALQNCGDIVGMTGAGEAACANELGIPFVSICSVDNYCNGLSPVELSYEMLLETSKKNADKMNQIVKSVVDILG